MRIPVAVRLASFLILRYSFLRLRHLPAVLLNAGAAHRSFGSLMKAEANHWLWGSLRSFLVQEMLFNMSTF